MAKDEQFYVFILITLLLDMVASLQLSSESMTKNVGVTFLINCKDQAGRPVQWKGPNGRLTQRTRPHLQQGSYGTAIVFENTRIEDTGNYTCSLTDSPREKKVFSLKVEEELKFIDTPGIQIAEEGKPYTIQCHVNLQGGKYTWFLANGEEIGKGNIHRFKVGDGLHISNVTRSDEQTYRCEARIEYSGKVNSTMIELIVHHKPVLPYSVYAEEEEVYAFKGELVNLTCEVEATPAPNFTWPDQRDGRVINVSSHISVLELNVTEDSPGTYLCTASNSLGMLKKYFDVQLGEHPDSPTNIELLKADKDSLEIKVGVPEIPYEVKDPVMDPQWIIIEYKPLSGDTWQSMEFNITADTHLIPDLAKSTKYEIRAATKNIAGLTYYNETLVFETSMATSVHVKLSTIMYLSILLISLFSIA